MKRTLVALGLVTVMAAAAAPAGAHLKSYTDGTNDAYQAGDVGTTAHVTPLDLAGASFRKKPANYKVVITLQDPLDVNLVCSTTTCGSGIEQHGIFSTDFYRVVDGAKKNWYFVEVIQDGSGNLIAGLFKVTNSGSDFVANATVTLSDDTLRVTIKAPRNKLKGHLKGRKIFWNATSAWWEASGAGFCEYDNTQAFGNACVDWIPDAADAPHKLQN